MNGNHGFPSLLDQLRRDPQAVARAAAARGERVVGYVGNEVPVALLLLLLGSVLDGLALMLLTAPILLPITTALGISPIWFGIFFVRTMEIGFVHPPVGINLYVMHSIAPDIPMGRVFKGVLPFLAADFVHLALLIAIPGMALALPAWLE